MPSWNETVGSSTYTEWVRSWRQNIECELGAAPVLTAWIETVRVYDADGKVEHFKWPNPIIISMPSLTGDELTAAMSVQTTLTSILGARVDAILNPPPPPPEPEPSPEEPLP